MVEKIEDGSIKEVNLSNKEIDVQSKSIATISEDMTTLGADYVKVLIDVQCRMCTFLFFKRHIIPRQSEKDSKILLDGIHDEGFLEIKVPFETAFALSTYMNESLKNIQKDNTIGMTFGPSEIVL
jgi:hypothetical protein